MPEEGRQANRGEQDQDEDVLELLEQHRPGRYAMGAMQFVQPVALLSCVHLARREPPDRVGA